MDNILDLVGQVSFPTSIVGGVIFLFFYLKKQEAELRAELTATLKRLQETNTALNNRIDQLEDEADNREATIDDMRKHIREVEDEAILQRRRADRAEARCEIAEEQRKEERP